MAPLRAEKAPPTARACAAEAASSSRRREGVRPIGPPALQFRPRLNHASFPLTLALSLGERERRFQRWDKSSSLGFLERWQLTHPFPKGENSPKRNFAHWTPEPPPHPFPLPLGGLGGGEGVRRTGEGEVRGKGQGEGKRSGLAAGAFNTLATISHNRSAPVPSYRFAGSPPIKVSAVIATNVGATELLKLSSVIL